MDKFIWKDRQGYFPEIGIMGIVNLTPDSFFDGSAHADFVSGTDYALSLHKEGADILDLGGESSRPGSEPIPAEQEEERVLPVLDALLQRNPALTISIDSYRASLAAKALARGARIINDISGCADPALLDILLHYKPGYVLMHSQEEDIVHFFERKLSWLVRSGFPEEHIILDPGIGFGKTTEENVRAMKHPELWAHFGRPSLMGLSMKSIFGKLLQIPLEQRSQATNIATSLCFERGYTWHRVHEVAKAKEALRLTQIFL